MKKRVTKIILSALLLAVVAVPLINSGTSFNNIGGAYKTYIDWPNPINP
ncbi:hypothetical protein [Clostridium manihotivorum]|nr:hypothetical protein [Clostridium manihotivorum]